MLSTKNISSYRKQIRELVNKINRLSFYCAHTDSLIKGCPGEVYRTCGNPGCKCAKNTVDRHGPYPVIQISKKGKSKQIAIRQDQKELWQKAKNYQKQMNNLFELKKCFDEVEHLIRHVIEERTEEFSV